MDKQTLCSLLWILLLFFSFAYANNIQLDTCWIVERDTIAGYYTIGFTLSWENSFRDSINYDAAWIFVKYRKSSAGDTFFHATLDTIDASHQVWSVTPMVVDASFEKNNWGTGVMIYRTDTANTDIVCDSVHLRWYYTRGQSMTNADSCTALRVFGIEMVYVPEGKFFVGDQHSSHYGFYRYNKIEYPPYQILSEDSIKMGTNEGDLWAEHAISTGILPSAFPKGYAPFYLMRYETTQGQYRDFLMTLDSSTAVSLYPGGYGSGRIYLRHLGNVYGCDGNGNAVLDEPDDGEWVSCYFLEENMILAYLDWAGLRPMTELEFEKACRGPKYPVANEYAWGTNGWTSGTSVEFACTDSERVIPAAANCNYNLSGYYQVRVGAYAEPNGNRIESGISFYGAVDMSTNGWEPVILITSSNFTGVHGDGVLSTTPGWPTPVFKRTIESDLMDGAVSYRWFSSAAGTARGVRSP